MKIELWLRVRPFLQMNVDLNKSLMNGKTTNQQPQSNKNNNKQAELESNKPTS